MKKIFKTVRDYFDVTPDELHVKHYTDSKLDLLEHAHKAEYHTAMVDMLRRRLARLEREKNEYKTPTN